MKTMAKMANTAAQAATTRASRARSSAARARQHDPQPDKKPERIAPHGKCAAAAHRDQRDHGSPGPNASSVTMRRSNVSADQPHRRGGFGCGQNNAAAMKSDGSRKKIWLPRTPPDAGYDRTSRAPRAARWLGIGERQEIGLEQPDDMRRGDDERDDEASHGPGVAKRAARVAVEQQEQHVGRRQDDDKIFGPQRAAEGEAEQEPVPQAAAPEGCMETRSRPAPRTAAG